MGEAEGSSGCLPGPRGRGWALSPRERQVDDGVDAADTAPSSKCGILRQNHRSRITISHRRPWRCHIKAKGARVSTGGTGMA